MFMLVVINAIGIMSWMALRMLGIENAGAWAVAAGFMYILPYFGSQSHLRTY